MIQFTCPSCKGVCSVDDRFAKRKIKCPKCGARVIHVRDSVVELLTAGTPPTEVAPAIAAPPATTPPGDATPVATAVVPHLVGEFVRQSESRQNTLVIGGLGLLFVAVLSGCGLILGIPLLTVAPIGVGFTALAIWLWIRKKKLEARLRPASSSKGTAEAATEPAPKA